MFLLADVANKEDLCSIDRRMYLILIVCNDRLSLLVYWFVSDLFNWLFVDLREKSQGPFACSLFLGQFFVGITCDFRDMEERAHLMKSLIGFLIGFFESCELFVFLDSLEFFESQQKILELLRVNWG